MAKRFFYVAAGIFLLVAAHQLGAKRAEADWQGTGLVVGTSAGYYVWNVAGQAYYTSVGMGGPLHWVRSPARDLPMPATEVKMLEGDSDSGSTIVVTNSDAVWLLSGETWFQMPPVPGGPVPVEGQSFGATKAKYR